MKRWNAQQMQAVGKTLFATIHKRKRLAQENHDIHLLARDIDSWLAEGIASLIEGNYDPLFLKQYHFSDEVVIQPQLRDRVLQHILLKELQPTFKHVMNPNCYHLFGPTGVKYATQHIKQALSHDNPQYFIRADIKAFYSSIPHHKLIEDVKNHYDDTRLHSMLENIIRNPIETYRGIKNPDLGIALRGPLSQFFSALYLKPLDDAFDNSQVTYVRYQDDILILCQTKRQMNRCWRKMRDVLQERRLDLSRKKSCRGTIEQGFHFLGIDYPPTQTVDNTTTPPVDAAANNKLFFELKLNRGALVGTQQLRSLRIKPHSRTIRKARVQIECMVTDGLSATKIRRYLNRWAQWWAKTSETWDVDELLRRVIDSCWDASTNAYALGTLAHLTNKSRPRLDELADLG